MVVVAATEQQLLNIMTRINFIINRVRRKDICIYVLDEFREQAIYKF
jgi:hypothetical protein